MPSAAPYVTGEGLVEVRSSLILPPGSRKLAWNLKYGSLGMTRRAGAWAEARTKIKTTGTIFLMSLILRPGGPNVKEREARPDVGRGGSPGGLAGVADGDADDLPLVDAPDAAPIAADVTLVEITVGDDDQRVRAH